MWLWTIFCQFCGQLVVFCRAVQSVQSETIIFFKFRSGCYTKHLATARKIAFPHSATRGLQRLQPHGSTPWRNAEHRAAHLSVYHAETREINVNVLSPVNTVAEKWDCHTKVRKWDSLTFLRQCGHAFTEHETKADSDSGALRCNLQVGSRACTRLTTYRRADESLTASSSCCCRSSGSSRSISASVMLRSRRCGTLGRRVRPRLAMICRWIINSLVCLFLQRSMKHKT